MNLRIAAVLFAPFLLFLAFVWYRDGRRMALDVFVFSGVGGLVTAFILWTATRF